MRDTRGEPVLKSKSDQFSANLNQKRVVVALVLCALVTLTLAVGVALIPEYAIYGLAAVGVGIPLLLLVWARPEIGILAIVFLASSLVPSNVIDLRLPIGGGFDLRDLVLVGVSGLVAFRELTRRTLTIPWIKVGGVLVFFLGLAVVSAIYAIVDQKVEVNWALGDLRILSSYVVFFLVMWSIRRSDQLRWLIFGLFIIADLVTGIIILQQFLGADNPLLQAMISTRDWRVYELTGAVRVVPAGHVLMHFMWFVALGVPIFAKTSQRTRMFLYIQLVYLGVGHILTFMRAQWLGMIIGFVLLLVVLAPKFGSAIPRYAMVALSVMLVIALLWGLMGLSEQLDIPLVTGITDRFATLFSPEETMASASLQWRDFENSKALEAIARSPIMGVGLGGRYRELTTFHGEASGNLTHGSVASGSVSRYTRYVHNSYMAIGVKMGIPGLLLLLVWFGSFLYHGWKAYPFVSDPQLRGVVLAILAAFIGLLEWSFTHAHLLKAESTPVIALMIGLVGVIVTNRDFKL